MSMPSFPPCGADMTKDEALTMIIASIAMEELALSHIVNAEGEKLQYILGTLPGGPTSCASAQDVLAVNKSVKELLDTVMQSQMLLKGKLEKALEAGGCAHAPAPEPPCSCGPAHVREPFCPAGSPGGCLCCQKSAIQLASRCNGFSWDNSFLLSWKCLGQRGHGIRWDGKTPALVGLDPAKAYAVNYTISVRNPRLKIGTGSVCVKLKPRDAFQDVLPLYFSAKDLGCEPLTLHYSTMLFPRASPPPYADLSLILNYEDSLFVDQASLSIFEI